jgi:hypothetical protein
MILPVTERGIPCGLKLQDICDDRALSLFSVVFSCGWRGVRGLYILDLDNLFHGFVELNMILRWP